MKKFVLINSPLFWERTNEEEEYLSPLGLGYIATYLKKVGLEVLLLDSVKERLGVEDILKQVSEIKPEFVGINVFTQNYELVQYIIEKMSIQCECFVGGQVVKSIYETILDWKTSNKVNIIIGEGELIIPAIVLENCKEKPIEHLDNKFVYKVDRNSQYFPEDISKIYLDRSFLKNEIINNHYGEKEAAIITSRGCAYDCACSGCLLIVYFQIKRKSPVNDAFMGLFFYTCKTNYKEVDVQKMRINGCAFVQFFVFFLRTRNIVP